MAAPGRSGPLESRSWSLTLKQRARYARFNPTPSEHVLWQFLRGKKLGVQFRRQVPIGGKFIVDFLAPSIKLVVEVDGGYHEQRVRLDAAREAKLVRAGYRVMRVNAELVMRSPEVAVQLVHKVMG